MWKKDLRTIILLLFFMLLFGVFYSLLSCTRTTQKAVTTHDTLVTAHSLTDSLNTHHGASDSLFRARTDTIYKTKSDTIVKTIERRDSFVVRDSVYVRERGDSVYVYKEKWRERLVFARDTIYKSRTDTLRQILRDTIYRAHADTVTVYKFRELNDSAYQSVDTSKETVKERRTLSWLKAVGVLILIFGGLAVWRKLR